MRPEIIVTLWKGAPRGRLLKLFCDPGGGYMGAFALRRVMGLYSRELFIYLCVLLYTHKKFKKKKKTRFKFREESYAHSTARRPSQDAPLPPARALPLLRPWLLLTSPRPPPTHQVFCPVPPTPHIQSAPPPSERHQRDMLVICKLYANRSRLLESLGHWPD